jgi:prolyl 4-hydroxylase
MKFVVALAVAIAVEVAIIVAALARRKRVEEFANESKLCGGVYYMEIPKFLSERECDALVEASVDLRPSEIGGLDVSVLDKSIRQSMQTWYPPGAHRVTDAIRKKTKALVESTGCLRGRRTKFEHVQVVRYGKGGKYDAHYDGDECEKASCPRDQRLATLLVYLNDDFDGGNTHFPLLNASVVPEKGKALFFWVADEETRDLFEKTLHAGVPVTRGRKWIANQWVRAAS